MKVEHNVSLEKYNSFGFAAVAEELITVSSVEELRCALTTDKEITLLGAGTNVVMRRFLPGRVIRLGMQSISTRSMEDGASVVVAESGRDWHDLVRFTLGQGIGGLENLALIPGLVGGAPYQNIGAYGVELSSVFYSASVLDTHDLEVKKLSVSECGFGYRDSRFKSSEPGRFIVLAVSLKLSNDRRLSTDYADVHKVTSTLSRDQLNASNIAESVIRIRRKKLPDPRRIGNVGSFFKNPVLHPTDFDVLAGKLEIEGHRSESGVKVSAARLIDEAGWKGVTVGRAQVWQRQPLVLVNLGGSNAEEVLELSQRIADDIHRRFDVELELEPVVLGQPTA